MIKHHNTTTHIKTYDSQDSLVVAWGGIQGALENVRAKEASHSHIEGDSQDSPSGDTYHVPCPLANPWVDHDHAHPSVPLPSYFPVLEVAKQGGDTFD